MRNINLGRKHSYQAGQTSGKILILGNDGIDVALSSFFVLYFKYLVYEVASDIMSKKKKVVNILTTLYKTYETVCDVKILQRKEDLVDCLS